METMLKACGEYRIIGRRDGRVILDRTYKNVVTQLYFDALFKLMDSTEATATAGDLKINVLATGSGTAAATKQDLQLQSEVFRKSITDTRITATSIEVITELTIADSNFTIKELGLFANANPLTPNDGTLISRVAISPIEKLASEQYQILYKFTIQEG
jgi:hypothetical protein